MASPHTTLLAPEEQMINTRLRSATVRPNSSFDTDARRRSTPALSAGCGAKAGSSGTAIGQKQTFKSAAITTIPPYVRRSSRWLPPMDHTETWRSDVFAIESAFVVRGTSAFLFGQSSPPRKGARRVTPNIRAIASRSKSLQPACRTWALDLESYRRAK